MDIVAGENFPEHISPFPEPSTLLYGHSTALIHPPEIHHRSQPPPQKLRPIRCNARLHPDDTNPTVGDFPEDGVLAGNLMNYPPLTAGGSLEVGFMSPFPLQEIRRLEDVYGDSSVKLEASRVPENGGGEFRSPENLSALIARSGIVDAEFSLSSDDGHDSAENISESGKQKRKRKTRKNIEFLMENLMMKVIKKQEQMHQQLIEMIEKMESDRIIREEAWKKQEMERAKRDKEIRAQEASRSLALISFIQNVLGHEIQIPKSTESFEEDEDEIHSERDYKYDPNNKRWPKSEVQALITVRTALDHKFRNTGSKNPIWEEVSTGLSNMGFIRTPKKCKEKWENMNKYFKRSLGSGKMHTENAKTCPYFNELELLYKNGLLANGKTSNSTTNNENDEEKDASEQIHANAIL